MVVFSLVLLWHFLHLSFVETSVLVVRVRAGLSSLLFNKISTLTNLTLRSQTGMIANLLSNDL